MTNNGSGASSPDTPILQTLIKDSILKDKNLTEKGNDVKKSLLDIALNDPIRKKYNLNIIFSDLKKNPLRKGYNKWQEEKQTDEDLRKMILPQHTNYGYYCGYNELISIDFDAEWIYFEVEKHFGNRFNTHTVQTPNGGYHSYFMTENPIGSGEFKETLNVEILGKKFGIVYGEVLNEQNEISEYKLIKEVPILRDNDIITDIISFLNDILTNYDFFRYKCIQNKLKNKINHLTHEQRLNIANFFLQKNANVETTVNFFRMCPDFDAKKSRQQVEHTLNKIKKDGLGYPTCDSLRENFGCTEDCCNGCIRLNQETKEPIAESNNVSNIIDSPEENKSKSQATLIAEYVEDNCELFKDDRDTGYVKYNVGNHFEVWPINSNKFKRWLFKIGKELNDDKIPNAESISAARNYIEAIAHDGEKIELYNRVAMKNGKIWYDLANSKWQVVVISKKGWKIIDNPPILFKRYAHQNEQVIPIEGGEPWKLFDFTNVTKSSELLVLVGIIAKFFPNIPHPVFVIYGAPGSGKSTYMESDRTIVDPSIVPRQSFPKGDKDLIQTFDHHYAPSFDNINTIPEWLSDKICRAVTGDGVEHRALYTDDDSVIRSYRRCITINGINVAATKSDLLDRSILIKLKHISPNKRVDEATLRYEFKKELPSILGGIFDVISKAMEIYPTIKLEKMHRMADFTKTGYAIAEALGGFGEEFLRAYANDEQHRITETIEASQLATAIVKYMADKEKINIKPTKLLNALDEIAENQKINTRSKMWPKSATWLSRRLNEIVHPLEVVGIKYKLNRSTKGREIYLYNKNYEKDEK